MDNLRKQNGLPLEIWLRWWKWWSPTQTKSTKSCVTHIMRFLGKIGQASNLVWKRQQRRAGLEIFSQLRDGSGEWEFSPLGRESPNVWISQWSQRSEHSGYIFFAWKQGTEARGGVRLRIFQQSDIQQWNETFIPLGYNQKFAPKKIVKKGVPTSYNLLLPPLSPFSLTQPWFQPWLSTLLKIKDDVLSNESSFSCFESLASLGGIFRFTQCSFSS